MQCDIMTLSYKTRWRWRAGRLPGRRWWRWSWRRWRWWGRACPTPAVEILRMMRIKMRMSRSSMLVTSTSESARSTMAANFQSFSMAAVSSSSLSLSVITCSHKKWNNFKLCILVFQMLSPWSLWGWQRHLNALFFSFKCCHPDLFQYGGELSMNSWAQEALLIMGRVERHPEVWSWNRNRIFKMSFGRNHIFAPEQAVGSVGLWAFREMGCLENYLVIDGDGDGGKPTWGKTWWLSGEGRKSSSISRTLASKDLEEFSFKSISFILFWIRIVFLVIFAPGRDMRKSQGIHWRKRSRTWRISW